ncbi:NIPSNAP family protein [Chryseolinea lacunae]|uniref:NIPSNAP family protein n=1 Tax=Chryseolinea lacunae TaxID=2801331 RepID=A0ABS1KYJ6_9BACT|nr:NIPSNAP family protein [Chryseolinea lacunae]MBL0744489.1 NIPSNAP family protein [Chryseolinea lacunae]
MKLLSSLFVMVSCVAFAATAAPKREFYEIKIYRVTSSAQEQSVEKYLKEAYLPALHRAGIGKVGVFKPVETDTTFGKRVYVLIPFTSMDQFVKLPETLLKDKQYETAGADYLNAPFDNPPYARIESILLQAFTGMGQLEAPKHTTPVTERVYELRSYEGHTEKIFQNKVKMFNVGDEIALFKRLGFNAVFYAEVLSGPRTPNLMYMTTFANQTSRDEHWKAFSADPEWKKLSGMSEYQHNVSKINIYFLRPVAYSEI